MTIILQSRIYRADLRANPNVLYVFGDNEARIGFGGQAAEMRGEPNAIGVATLSAPGVFWREDNHDLQAAVIDRDMTPLFVAKLARQLIIFPLDGIGTGLAQLETRAPTTFAHLQRRIEELKAA